VQSSLRKTGLAPHKAGCADGGVSDNDKPAGPVRLVEPGECEEDRLVNSKPVGLT